MELRLHWMSKYLSSNSKCKRDLCFYITFLKKCGLQKWENVITILFVSQAQTCWSRDYHEGKPAVTIVNFTMWWRAYDKTPQRLSLARLFIRHSGYRTLVFYASYDNMNMHNLRFKMFTTMKKYHSLKENSWRVQTHTICVTFTVFTHTICNTYTVCTQFVINI